MSSNYIYTVTLILPKTVLLCFVNLGNYNNNSIFLQTYKKIRNNVTINKKLSCTALTNSYILNGVLLCLDYNGHNEIIINVLGRICKQVFIIYHIEL